MTRVRWSFVIKFWEKADVDNLYCVTWYAELFAISVTVMYTVI